MAALDKKKIYQHFVFVHGHVHSMMTGQICAALC